MVANRPVLYSFRRCPYAMRARLALIASAAPCFIREIKLSAKPTEMLALSSKGTVPVLALTDNGVIDESLDIMRWALGQNDPLGWLEREDVALIAANDGAFKHHLDRYKYPQRHGSDPLEHRMAGLTLLGAFEQQLIQTAHLGGETMGLTDVALFPFVRQFAEVDRLWFDAQPLPGLQRWLAQHLASPLFAAAMIRLAPWQPGDAPLALPLMPNFP